MALRDEALLSVGAFNHIVSHPFNTIWSCVLRELPFGVCYQLHLMLCSNRPEAFGPNSHLYSHILTSCFIDTILVPLCTWLYFLTVLLLLLLSRRKARVSRQPLWVWYGGSNAQSGEQSTDNFLADGRAEPQPPSAKRPKPCVILSIVYYLFLLAQVLMCILEITRLSLAHLGIGLLPFSIVSIVVAGGLHATRGINGRVSGWEWATLALWVALAVTNGVKVAEEVKEGTNVRQGSKYPVADEVTDVSVMIGVYLVLAILEVPVVLVWS